MALREQFCLTRTYAIATGEDMMRRVQGLSQAQIEQQCDAFGPALAPFGAAQDSSDSVAVRSQVQRFALQSNMALEQLKSTATICLFTGYRRDKMDVALGSALLLVDVGHTPYSELVGHHLANGFGVARNHAGARDWYGVATDALDNADACRIAKFLAGVSGG